MLAGLTLRPAADEFASWWASRHVRRHRYELLKVRGQGARKLHALAVASWSRASWPSLPSNGCCATCSPHRFTIFAWYRVSGWTVLLALVAQARCADTNSGRASMGH